MPKTYEISEEDTQKIVTARKNTKDKRVDKRLHAVQLRGEGQKNDDIAKKLDCSPKVVSRWVSDYIKGGITALKGGKYGSNRRNIRACSH